MGTARKKEGAHLGRQPLHNGRQVLVEVRGRERLEDVVVVGLARAEGLQALVNALARLAVRGKVHRLLEEHRVFAEELELNLVAVLDVAEVQVLLAQRAAAHGVGLVLALLAAHAQGELVDDPHGHAHLALALVLGHNLVVVVAAHLVDAVLELDGLAVLFSVALALEGRRGGQHDVLDAVLHVFVPRAQPRDAGVVAHLHPGAAGQVAARHGRVHAKVDGHALGEGPLLQLARLGVVAAPTKQPRGLHVEVAHLLQTAVDDGVAALQRVDLRDALESERERAVMGCGGGRIRGKNK